MLSCQCIEGGVDATLYENFVYETLKYVRTSEELKHKKVILFMDNALIHRHSSVLETARKFKVNVLFNAEYSPWLNPIEQLFSYLKKGLHPKDIARK